MEENNKVVEKLTGKIVDQAIEKATKPLKTILLIVGLLIIVAAVVFAGIKLNWFNFSFHKELTIDKTANVVEEVKKIGEFTTACYYEEMALQDSYEDTVQNAGHNDDAFMGKASRKLGFGKKLSEMTSSATAGHTSLTNEIVLIGKGRVRAGFDLAKLQDNDFIVHGDTLELTLPSVEVFDIIMNPSDFTTEYEKGTWSHELTKPIKERARVQLEQNALEYGILKKAEESGLKRLESLFRTFGFNTVLFTVSKPDAEITESMENIVEKTVE